MSVLVQKGLYHRCGAVMFSFHSLSGKRRSAFFGQYLSDIGMDALKSEKEIP